MRGLTDQQIRAAFWLTYSLGWVVGIMAAIIWRMAV